MKENRIIIKELENIKKIKEKHQEDKTLLEIEEYLISIKDYEVISKDEEQELLIKASNGDKNAKEKLYLCNLYIGYLFAKENLKENGNLMELIKESNKGLDFAIDNYKMNSKVKFHSFMIYSMNNEISKNTLKNKTKKQSLKEFDKESKDDANKIILNSLNNLNKRDREIFIRKYGLNNKKKLTIEELEKKYHVTSSYIKDIESLLIYTIKCKLRSN